MASIWQYLTNDFNNLVAAAGDFNGPVPVVPTVQELAQQVAFNSIYGKVKTPAPYNPPKPKNTLPDNIGGSSVVTQLAELFPDLIKVDKACPACGQNFISTLNAVIVHLNDGHRWPREKIADWLDIIALDNPKINLTLGGSNARADTDKEVA